MILNINNNAIMYLQIYICIFRSMEENIMQNAKGSTGNFANTDNISGAVSGIVCDATNCYYNHAKACSAKQVKVGPQGAVTSGDTVCDTFRPR